MTAPSRITLLGRPGCHLCDDARVALRRITSDLEIGFNERSIVGDPDLEARWADYVPVFLVDGRVIGWFQVDETRLLAALRAGPG
ncbi:MAG TPA: glutaredoxin family protein [Mycobacteriales bacterium]|nr:glutaredoxin family protein [Mycobacteriales bacterium]